MVPPDILDSSRSRAALAVPEATKRLAATTANKSTAVLNPIPKRLARSGSLNRWQLRRLSA